jgi:dienelactone hydrolase
MRKMLSLWLVVLLLTACGRAAAKASPTPGSPGAATLAPVHVTTVPSTAVPAATAAATASVAPAARPTPAAPVSVTITAGDGAKLSAAYYPPVLLRVAGRGAPGVLLLHGASGSRADWDPFARQLQAQGMAALALDFRGQGASAGPEDWTKSVDDTHAAWLELLGQPGVNPERTAIVGASIGANLALIVGANNDIVSAVAALSPGDDFQGIRPTGVLSNFGNRPVYLIASQDDTYSYTSVQHMAPNLTHGETFFYTNAGHGTAMFSDPDLATRLLGWLAVHIGDAKG